MVNDGPLYNRNPDSAKIPSGWFNWQNPRGYKVESHIDRKRVGLTRILSIRIIIIRRMEHIFDCPLVVEPLSRMTSYQCRIISATGQRRTEELLCMSLAGN